MKTILLIVITALIMPLACFASVSDPVADFKAGLVIAPADKILKWICNINGDGKGDVLLCLKSDFDKSTENNELPSWIAYIINGTGSAYTKSTGTSEQPDSLSVDDMPTIDPDLCFIGQVTELGKCGIVTITYATPRSGITTATIYAYAVEGDHLKRTQLAQYDPDRGANAVFDKYLADGKRTHVTLREVTP